VTPRSLAARLARLEQFTPAPPDACPACGAVERLQGWRVGGFEAFAPWCPACGSHDYAKVRAHYLPPRTASAAGWVP